MKKLFVLFAAAMLTASASAQGTAVTSSKLQLVCWYQCRYCYLPQRKIW